MSGVTALAKPRRIKASHRRRRKVASDHLLYILNNPLSGTDPTGYCAAETGTNIKSCETVTVEGKNAAGEVIESRSVSVNKGTLAAWASSQKLSMANGGTSGQTTQGADKQTHRDTSSEYQVASRRENTASGVPRKVEMACRNYQAPASCGSDAAIDRAAKTGVAVGVSQLNPEFRNSIVDAASRTEDGVVQTSLGYQGDVDDRLTLAAAKDWTGDGKDVQMSLVRQSDSGPLRIDMTDTPGMASLLKLCTCTTAYWVGGHTDLKNSQILLNGDRDFSTQKESLKHELGHFFFGRGHPTKQGDLGFGGVMQYGDNRINKADRLRYKRMYEKKLEGSP